MSERFSKVFALSGSLYAAGAPVVISAGALLKDNQSGNIYAQLKFCSISKQRIKAVHIIITPFDTAGQSLGTATEYQYLDLNAERGAEFGQKVPILVPDNHTRSFSITVDEVIFQDNSKWKIGNEAWEPLPAHVSLVDAFPDENIRRQFQLDIGKSASYIPTEHKDLWYCACGALNHAEESTCTKCGLELKSLLAANQPELLQRHYEQRKAEEDAKKAEIQAKKAEAAKRRAGQIKKASILGVSLILIAGIIFGGYSLISTLRYKKAVEAFGYETTTISAGYYHTVGLKTDGTVVAVGGNTYGQCNVNEWEKVISISADGPHVVALKSDGTVVAAGSNRYGQSNVNRWKYIVAISAGSSHTIGLKSDGTVVATGWDNFGQCDVSEWTDVVSVSAGSLHTVGLKSDGTVVAVGNNIDGQCDVQEWTDIVAVSAGYSHTVGLRSDGTVVAVGNNSKGQCSVQEWTDIVAVSAGCLHTVGLRSDGTVVAVGSNRDGQCYVTGWKDIVAISAGYYHTVCLKSNGTVVAIGQNGLGECNVGRWTDIRVPENRK